MVPLPQLTLQSPKLFHAVNGLITGACSNDERGTSVSTVSDSKPQKKKKEFLLKGNKQTIKEAPNCWFTGDYLVHVLAIIVKRNWLVRDRFRKLSPVKQIL